MAENSAIEWTTHTFNPWVGCTKISPACDHCYAESWAKRTGGAALWQGERRRTTVSNWRQPLKWNAEAERSGRRARVFCASLADVFDNQIPWDWRNDLFCLITLTPWLDWQLLTKRPQNIAKMLPDGWGAGYPNVWLGTTVANQEEADRNIPHLLRVPAAKRFLSCEPLLGPIDVRPWLPGDSGCEECDDGEGWGNRCSRSDIPRDEQCPRRFEVVDYTQGPEEADGMPGWVGSEKRVVDWVIVGGESGGAARPMHPEWPLRLRDHCAAARVPFFFKQWGAWTPVGHIVRGAATDPAEFAWQRIGKKAAGALLDGREWREMPA